MFRFEFFFAGPNSLGTFPMGGNIYLLIAAIQSGCGARRETVLKFYTIKLPKFLGGIVKVVIGAFSKD